MPDRVRRPRPGRAALAIGLVTVLMMAATGSSAPASAADGGPNHRGLSGWVPYWEDTDGRASFLDNSDLFEELSPFWHSAAGGPGDIVLKASPSSLAPVIQAARSRGVPVVPTITDGNGPLVMAGYLADPVTRSQHVDAIVALVGANGYDGIDIDYEGFAFNDGKVNWAAIQPNWVAFVQELGAKLHAQSRRLTVSVPPIYFAADGKTVLGYTVYDWANIIASVDRLRVMTYDWSVGAAGPISPSSYVQRTIAYAQSIGVPMSKVQIGIPLYGRDWVTKQVGTCSAPSRRSVTNRDIDALIAERGATPSRDGSSGELTFTYTETIIGTGEPTTPDPQPPGPIPPLGGIGTATATQGAVRMSKCTRTRTVWYLDAVAIADRAARATDAGAGVAVWALGYDAWWSWDALRLELAPQR
jgi:spore germination protein YaaH